jgi:hypothetical protein
MSEKAIKNAVPIQQNELDSTINSVIRTLSTIFNLDSSSISLIGSTYKNPYNIPPRDVDFIVFKNHPNLKELSLENIKNKIQIISPEVKIFNGLNIISFAYPIQIRELETPEILYYPTGVQKIAQIDLMFVDDMEMAKWFYFVPHSMLSKYKGVHRNILLSVVASLVALKPTKYYQDTTVEWMRFYLDPSGLYYGRQSIEGKNGKPTNSRRTLERKLITNKPREIMTEIFGPKCGIFNTDSFERIWAYINSDDFPFKYRTPIIAKRTKEIFENAGIIVPEELIKYAT